MSAGNSGLGRFETPPGPSIRSSTSTGQNMDFRSNQEGTYRADSKDVCGCFPFV